MSVVHPEDELLVITTNGLGKRMPIGLGTAGAEVAEDEKESTEVPEDNDDATVEAELEEDDTAAKDRANRRYRLTRRAAKGVVSIKLRPGDRVVAALQVDPDASQELLVTSVQGQMVRMNVADVSVMGRSAFGVIVMRLNEDDQVASATLIDELSEEEIAANQAQKQELEELAARMEEFDARQMALREAAETDPNGESSDDIADDADDENYNENDAMNKDEDDQEPDDN